uniref:Zinc knuckle CX2CX4HX4C n=1 Tax=Tanacetum cinerariifolium TaxID=118510 RepID=A0A6L2J889_TANCI|nr:zinc knuckle CX2CX4HX4C [Tanacetum cinerariifolium]
MLSQTDSMAKGHNISVSSYVGRAVPKPNADPKHAEPVTKAIPTSFGEFSTMNPSSEPVVDTEKNPWSFRHDGPASNSIKSSFLDAENPKAFESIWSSGRVGPPPMNYEGLGVTVNSESTQFVQSEINNDDQTNPQTLDAPIIHEASIRVDPVSYVGVASSKQPTALKGESSNFKFIKVDNVFEGVALSMPRRVVENVSTRFENTFYRYFIRKRLVFTVVEYFVKNNWSKYGLKRIMLNAKGFFFFKFDSRAGLEEMLLSLIQMIIHNLNPVDYQRNNRNKKTLRTSLILNRIYTPTNH